VDDHELARIGLRGMLAGDADLEVAGEAANVADALALCDQLQPDVVLLDIRMPGQDGLEAIASIQEVSPTTKIIMFTIHDDPTYVVSAVKAGAAGYVLKDATRKEILETVRGVLRGEVALDPRLAVQLVQELAVQRAPPDDPLVEPLTSRETDVLRLIIEGQTNPQIAIALGIGRGTVKSHVQRIIAKLGVADRTQAAVRGVQLGLIEIDPATVEQADYV
jgi:DNA-binding NarL/FixJ family response regulator